MRPAVDAVLDFGCTLGRMSERDWNEHYAEGFLPWDSDEPEPELVAAVESGLIVPGRVLEVGCGTGTNAVWLAQRGFVVVAVDIAPLAIERARPRADDAGVEVRFAVHDFLSAPAEGGPFDLVFDRGVLHVFDDHADRARFARHVAQSLTDSGQWLTLAGSTEGKPRDVGPPRRTARDLVNAIEPELEVVDLHAFRFEVGTPEPAAAWALLSRRRHVPAVEPTRR
jgi:SAM-dependent methyltransferase